MGSGKSTVGRLVAAELNLRFVDMDRLIEEREHRSVGDIFQKDGERRFREIEHHLVRELSEQQGLVIATGGGVILNPENVERFSRSAVVIGLRVDGATAFARTKTHGHRPLLKTQNPLESIGQLLEERGPLYEALPHVVESSNRSAAEVALDVVEIYLEQVAGPH